MNQASSTSRAAIVGIPADRDAGEPDAADGFEDAALDAARLLSENARLTEAIAARESFLAFAAHELRNPITPILGRVTMLRRAVARGDLSSQDIVSRLEHIEGLVNHFIKRATTLLDVSRISSNLMQVECRPVDLCGLMRDVTETLRPVASHAGADLDVDCPTGDIAVLADALALEQVLENLLSNAIKYGAGTPIAVTASADPARGVASIAVRDEGPGIPEILHARIFERFERAVQPGAEVTGYGVGLWIVRNLCEAMNGTIDVTSATGMGATFRVTLPLSAAHGDGGTG